MFFSRLFRCELTDESAENLENDITEEPSTKKSKTEELNDILRQPEYQHLDRVQENVLTHIKKETAFYEATRECPKILTINKVLSKLTFTLFCRS